MSVLFFAVGSLVTTLATNFTVMWDFSSALLEYDDLSDLSGVLFKGLEAGNS